jgi:hypothetical protein
MAVIQDTYNDTPARGFPGMVVNMEASNRLSRTVEDAAGLAFGAGAFRGTGDRGCTGTAAAGVEFLGFVIADHGQPLLPGGTADTIPQYESAAIIGRGVVCVQVGGDVDAGDPVTIGTGAGAADGISATPADATHIAAPGWVFDETVADGGICAVARR